MEVGKWQQILVKIYHITFGANPHNSSRASASCWSSRRPQQHSSQRGTGPAPPVNIPARGAPALHRQYTAAAGTGSANFFLLLTRGL